MLPHEKALVKRLENQPFALIGINSDGDAAKVKKILGDNDITWRQAIEGSTGGPLARAWRVHSWPTIYVLDAQGRIRYQDLRGPPLEDAVVKLLGEVGGAK